MSALDFDISPAEAPPPPEVNLEGTRPPPPEDEPPSTAVKMEVKEEEGRFDEEELEDIELPEMPVKKPKLTNDEVFAPKVQPVKKPKRKRKPPTPEQLERLAEARKKAFAVRSAKKKERDEMKALEKKVAQKKKAKLEQEIMDTLDEDELPETMKQARKYKEKKMDEDYQRQKPPVPTTPVPQPSLTAEDLRKAIAEGVEIYDTKRKAQKKVKREKQAEEQRQNEVKQKIQRAISVNPWDEFLK